jgi:hypothetical protein
MIYMRGGHVAHPDREMDRVQRRITGACPCHPWVKTRPPSTDASPPAYAAGHEGPCQVMCR